MHICGPSKYRIPSQDYHVADQIYVKVANTESEVVEGAQESEKVCERIQEWKHIVSEELDSLPQVCQTNYDCSRRANSRKLKYPHRRFMQHKYTPKNNLPPIAEDGELEFEELWKLRFTIWSFWK